MIWKDDQAVVLTHDILHGYDTTEPLIGSRGSNSKRPYHTNERWESS